MSGPPPPPPPHGSSPKSSGLPDGKYDIFVIPPHSAGSGFLYLPSLQPNINSFVAGFACALFLVVLGQSMAPAFRAWWDSFHGLGNMGIALLMLAIGFGAWSLGRTQKIDPQNGAGSGSGPGDRPGSGQRYGGGYEGAYGAGSSEQDGSSPRPPPHGNGGPGSGSPPPPPPGQDKQKYQWQQQRPNPSESDQTRSPPPGGKTKTESAKGSWEKARDEMRRKEEERKTKEAEQKRREETQRRLAELRAKEARERQEREKERTKRDEEARTRKEKAEAEVKAKELAAQLEREKKERERLEKEVREKRQAAEDARKGSSYAYSGVGEKTSMWPNGRPAAPPHGSTSAPGSGSPRKPPAPTARTYVSTEEEGHSYRPYDQKKPRRKSFNSVDGSEASWAASQTTARTSPPPSFRGPYSTKDPDKIVIQAVYLFMNQFAKTPASQLISGVGSVTDGLILRITTEGLFIDDDVRGVPQREWDVKAWTLKLVEVWCPPHCLTASSASSSGPAGAKNHHSSPSMFAKLAGGARNHRDRGGNSAALTGEEADNYLTEMLYACKNCCRLGLCDRKLKDADMPAPGGQTGEWKSKGLHVLRATVRDQDAKRYVFVLDETEAWKMAVGVQRLRRGTQARQLGVTGIAPAQAREALEMLGW